MFAKRLPLIAAAVLIVIIAGLITGAVRAETLPQTVGDQETIVLGQTRFAPGSTSALRLIVRDTRNAAPRCCPARNGFGPGRWFPGRPRSAAVFRRGPRLRSIRR